MNVNQLRTYCLAFPGATETLQWGDALCFKINAKMFAVLGLDHVRLTFKCTSEQFAELIERQDIRPAPYVGRHHWVMLERLDALENDELRDLIRQSYEMVAAKAPKKRIQRPGRKRQRIKEKTTERKKGAKNKGKRKKP
jgi:predicted DNA-binding protein (MmcQ/YjbR family)